jgi:effector-binding domain-containing protein
MDQTPQITNRSAQPYVGIKRSLTMAKLGSLADRIPEIFGWLGARGIAPAGAPFFRYYVIDMETEMQVEAGVPVATAVEGDGDVQPGTLPAGRFAVAEHVGEPASLEGATKSLLEWAAGQGLAWDVTETEAGEEWGCRVEFYLTDPAEQPDLSKWVTQLAFKLAD